MATHGPGGDTLDRLELGSGEPVRGPRPWWRAAVVLVVGVVLGWGAAQAYPSARASQSDRPRLMVGAFEQNLQDPLGPEFLVGVYNTGSSRVLVEDVTPQGWVATMAPVSLSPGRSIQVPVDISLDCYSMPSPSEIVVVRTITEGASHTFRVRLAGTPETMLELYRRRCSMPSLTRPTAQDLLGTWVVEDGGPAFTGKMLFRFDADGSYRMDTGTHLADKPGSIGRFVLNEHGGLTLTTRNGGECLLGHRARWRVGLLSAGRMHIRLLTPYDGFCSVEPGDVWIAKRVVS